jgi:phosphoesterase RecJ-like protein
MDQLVAQKIHQRLSQSPSILLISHQNPDGDALGSLLSLLIYWRRQGKQVGVFLASPAPSYFDFLPESEALSNQADIFSQRWATAVFVDSGDFGHAAVEPAWLSNSFLINIDHHHTNKFFAHLNLVDFQAGSTCELIYQLFSRNQWMIDRAVATCLLSGIWSDTGGFSNSATNTLSIGIAADLIRHGARIDRINNQITRRRSLAGLRLWGLILARLELNQSANLAYTYVRAAEFDRFQVREEEADGIVNFLNLITDVSAAAFLRLESNQTKVSLRTHKADVDVSRLAAAFGGGGHQKAAGFTIAQVISSDHEIKELVEKLSRLL